MPHESSSVDPFWNVSAGPAVTLPHDDEKLAFQCSWYLTSGYTVGEIADAVGKSNATVYRAIGLAEKLGILDRSPRVALPSGEGAKELYDLVRIQRLEDALQKRMLADTSLGEGSVPREVIVVRAAASKGEWERDREAVAETRRRISIAGARRLMLSLLRERTRVVGMSWGWQLQELSSALPGGVADRIPYEEAKRVEVFSCAGAFVGGLGPPGPEEAEQMLQVSGNANAALAVDRLNRFAVEPPAALKEPGYERQPAISRPVVITQPLIIPSELAGEKGRHLLSLWYILSKEASVLRVFGDDWTRERRAEAGRAFERPGADSHRREDPSAQSVVPLMHRAHALITGVGGLHEGDRVGNLVVPTSEERDALRAAGAVAGMSTHFLRERPLDPAPADAIEKFNSRVITPRPKDFAEATRRARITGVGIGTMLLARHPRAAAVRAALATGAVNILVCDDLLAQELLRG